MVASAAGAAFTMAEITDKMKRDARLTVAEQHLAISNAANLSVRSFGPMPEDVRVPNIPIPENVKGVLANFAF
jgi:hypothetical protein